VLEPGIAYHNYPNSTFNFNASLIITLNNGFQVQIPNYELVHPLRGLASNGSRVLNTSFMEVQVYSEAVALGASVLGKAFLSQVRLLSKILNLWNANNCGQVYLAVDYDQKIFKLAQINTDAVIPVPVLFRPCPSKLSATSIGLIVLGIVVALVLLPLGVLFIAKKVRETWNPKTSNDLSPEPITSGGPPVGPEGSSELSDIGDHDRERSSTRN
jgi:hypothetical protein